MTDITFLDTETLGLRPDAPIWEFAAIRRSEVDESEKRFECFIDHYPLPWLDHMPEEFATDYRSRYRPELAVTQYEAARLIIEATKDNATVVGAVPNFDTERLERLLSRAYGFHDTAPWHYHLVDVENLVVGFLAGRGTLINPPYDSDSLSVAVGVSPSDFKRHTAMGDVLWVQAQYDAVMKR